ncbi:hypothetical protein JL721_6540 [Aureococcus anophagefferens]|nr:hypothetical protein JL721_6540 [Aureococcus anophagefferens]
MGLDEDYGDEFHDDDEQLEEVGAAPLFDASDALAEDSMADIKALAMSSPAVGNVGDDDYDEEYAEEFEDEHPSPAKAAPPAVPAAAYGAPEDDGYDDRTAAIDEPLDDEPAVGEAVRRSGADAADLASFAGEPLELDGASAGFADPSRSTAAPPRRGRPRGALPDLVTGLESALRAAQEGQRRADARAAGAQKRERGARRARRRELDEVMGYANAMRSMLSEGSSVIEPGASLAVVEPGASVAATAGEPDAAAPRPRSRRRRRSSAPTKYQLRSSREVLNLKADREKKAKEVERLEATLVQRERDLRLQQATVMKLKGNLEKLIERYHKLKAAANSQVSSASQVLSTLIEPNKSPSASHANISPVSSASAFSKASPEKRDAEPVEPADGAFVTQPKGGAFDAMAAQFHPVKPEIPPPDRIRTKKSPRPHNAG